MLLIPHTAVAVAIATVFKEPKFVLPLALLFHFIIDLIPHWDPPPIARILDAEEPVKLGRAAYIFILLDFSIALWLALFFVWRALPDTALAATIFTAAFLTNVPDGLSLPLLFGKRWNWVLAFRRFHRATHIMRPSFPWGVLPQVAAIAIGLLIALR